MGRTYSVYPEDCLVSAYYPLNRRLYRVFYDMHKRCKPGAREARNYFDRGIRVCEEWSEWPNFCHWAKENGCADGLELDRKDNDLGYSPANCRWATQREQSANQRHIKYVIRTEIGDAFESLAIAQEITGAHRNTISKCARGLRPRAGGYKWAFI